MKELRFEISRLRFGGKVGCIEEEEDKREVVEEEEEPAITAHESF